MVIKMKKLIKILLVLVTIFLLFSILNNVQAKINPGDYNPGNGTTDPKVDQMANKVIGACQAIGSIVSVIALIVIGIKYAMCGAEDKAVKKESFIFYTIGAILVFATPWVAGIIYKFVSTW